MQAWSRELKPEEILSVNTAPDRLGGLAIGEMLPELHHGHQGELPWRHAGGPSRESRSAKVSSWTMVPSASRNVR